MIQTYATLKEIISFLDFMIFDSIQAILTIVILTLLLLSWSRVATLSQDVVQLKKIVKDLITILEKKGIQVSQTHKPNTPANDLSAETKQVALDPDIEAIEENRPEELSASKTQALESEPVLSFEEEFSARLPVWVGGVALALAGFFLIKYSIDHGILTPIVRVILAGLFGIASLYSAHLIRKKPNFANGLLISQSLSGAGIIVLYISVFAASSLYHLLPHSLAFLGMAAITATAIILSLKHGPAIALFGLIGGLLAPGMLASSSQLPLPLLLIYVYLMFSALMIIIKRKSWWKLSLVSLLGTSLWLTSWMDSNFTSADTIWVCLFLVAISSTIIINSKQTYEQTANGAASLFNPVACLNYIGLSFVLALMGFVAGNAGFSFVEWSLFGFLALGGIGLAYFDDELYGFVPWVSMAINIVMLFTAGNHDVNTLAMVLLIFAALYAAAGYFLMWRTRRPILWAGLVSATSVGFYLLAFFKLHNTSFLGSIPFLWGSIALLIASAAIYTTNEVRKYFSDHPHREFLLATFAATASLFVTIGLMVELNLEFLSIAFATQMLATSRINNRIPIKILRTICQALAVGFWILLAPQILETLTVEPAIFPIAKWPVVQLGLPAVMFIFTSYFLSLDQDDKLVQSLEISSILLIAIMAYFLTRHVFHFGSDILPSRLTFLEQAGITNMLFAFGAACLFISRKFSRKAFFLGGSGLCAFAALRIITYEFLHNPLWSHIKISGVPIFNSLLLPYGLTIIWAWLASEEFSTRGINQIARYYKGLVLLLIFAFISLNVRYLFQGEYLNGFIASSAEVYSYSVAWLLLSIGLFVLGVVKRDKMLHIASLGIMLLAIAKVFLYDASELEGLYRVLSFFGLGVSLIGLSWLYSTYVLKTQNQKTQQGHT